MVNWFFLIITGLSAQEARDTMPKTFQFSGALSVNTNGISPIPAFSLEKPAIISSVSLRKKRFSYDPEMAFSIKGVPWYLNSFLRYRLIEKKNFQFRTGVIWGIGYSYPIVLQNSVERNIAKAERFFWLELMPRYKFSNHFALSSITFNGYNFEPGSVKRIDYYSIIGNVTNLRLIKKFYCNIFPQLFYLNIDGANDGFFLSGILGIGHKELPLFLSTQMNSTLTTNMTPDPGFKWDVGLSYSFK